VYGYGQEDEFNNVSPINSANAAIAPSSVRDADPSTGAVLHLAQAAHAPSTLCAEGSSTGAASASANTAALPPGFSAANSPQARPLSQQEYRLTHQ